MKNFLIASCLAFLFVPSPASAADWVYFSTSTTGAEWYADRDTFKRTGNRAIVWVKIDFSADSTVTFREEKRNLRLDCDRRMLKLLSFIEYNADGTVRNSQSFSDYSDSGMKPIAPDTIAESLFEMVCN